jgi:signal transduction histidine kinase
MADDVPPGSLFELLKEEREQLITSWGNRIKSLVASAALPRAELLDHMPAFVDEIIQALFPAAVPLPPTSARAEQHGEQRLSLGFDVAEVVREYGTLHECILDLAAEAGLDVDRRDQLIVVKWLNVGIADAVSQYVKERDLEVQRQSSEHLGFIAHELRNPLGSARLAFERLRRKELHELKESRTVDMLDRGLRRTSEMIDSVLSQASLKMGVVPRLAPVALRPFLKEIEADAAAAAVDKGIQMEVSAPEDLVIEADPRLLRSAVSNLLHNAVKFSHDKSTVVVSAGLAEGRVTIEVADACGGLPPGKVEELFNPLVQRGENRSGFGLGLGIALQAAEAHNGTIKVRDMPGKGCAFILDLPSTTTSHE